MSGRMLQEVEYRMDLSWLLPSQILKPASDLRILSWIMFGLHNLLNPLHRQFIKDELFTLFLRIMPLDDNFITYRMGAQNDCQCRITCKALVLAHDLPCVLYQPQSMDVMDFYGGWEGIEGLHRGLHSDYSESRITFWEPLTCSIIIFTGHFQQLNQLQVGVFFTYIVRVINKRCI